MRLTYFLRRVMFLVLVIWTAASINFILPHLTGRDPIREMMLQQVASAGRTRQDAEIISAMYTNLFGLNRPLWQQYLTYIWNVSHLEFGMSVQEYPRTVMAIIIARARVTVPFVVIGILIGFVCGTLIGAFLGWKKTPRWLSNIIVPPLLVCSSVPQFLVALVAINYLAFELKWFPLGDAYPATMLENWGSIEFIKQYLYHAALPILCIVLTEGANWAMGMRAMMVTVEGDDYATFAEAKGLTSSRIFLRYLMRNAILPSLTGFAIRLGFIITGAAVMETFFNYAGIGSRLNQAISVFDYFVIYGICLIMVISIALATFVMDMIYPLLDPRISYRAQKG